eukprot:m.24451 g.24451  ORF g.24451 m.24451 type:complete len:800 (+) comp14613_c0_seq2:391-2790(+)
MAATQSVSRPPNHFARRGPSPILSPSKPRRSTANKTHKILPKMTAPPIAKSNSSDQTLRETIRTQELRIKQLTAEVEALRESEAAALSDAARLRAMVLRLSNRGKATPPSSTPHHSETTPISSVTLGVKSKKKLEYAAVAESIKISECTIVHLIRLDDQDSLGFEIGRLVAGRGYLVVDVVEGGPADIAGLVTNDVILSIDHKDLRKLDMDAVRDLLTNDADTLVTLHLAPEAPIITSTPMKRSSPQNRRAMYRRDKIGPARGIYPEMPKDVSEKMYMPIRARLMGKSAAAPDLWTFFLGWRRWREKLAIKALYTSNLNDSKSVHGGDVHDSRQPLGAKDTKQKKRNKSTMEPGSPMDITMTSGDSDTDYDDDDSVTDNVMLEYKSQYSKMMEKGLKQHPKFLDTDFHALEALIQSRKQTGSRSSSGGELDVLNDISGIHHDGTMTSSYTSNTDDADGSRASRSPDNNVAAFYTSDIYATNTSDDTVAWEQFKALFSEVSVNNNTNNSSSSRDNDNTTTNDGDVDNHQDLNTTFTTEVDDVQVHDAVPLDQPRLRTPLNELMSIDLEDTRDHTVDIDVDVSKYSTSSRQDVADAWSSNNRQQIESAAEKAWRNTYIDQAKYEPPLTRKTISEDDPNDSEPTTPEHAPPTSEYPTTAYPITSMPPRTILPTALRSPPRRSSTPQLSAKGLLARAYTTAQNESNNANPVDTNTTSTTSTTSTTPPVLFEPIKTPPTQRRSGSAHTTNSTTTTIPLSTSSPVHTRLLESKSANPIDSRPTFSAKGLFAKSLANIQVQTQTDV